VSGDSGGNLKGHIKLIELKLSEELNVPEFQEGYKALKPG
jgi:hypothetical protein